MTRARDLAEQANNSVWLGAAQKVLSLVVAPLLVLAILGYVTLFSRMTLSEAEAVTLKGRVAGLELVAAGLRSDITLHAGSVTRLQAQRESDADIVANIRELRTDLGRSTAAVNLRIDGMMTPPQRMRP